VRSRKLLDCLATTKIPTLFSNPRRSATPATRKKINSVPAETSAPTDEAGSAPSWARGTGERFCHQLRYKPGFSALLWRSHLSSSSSWSRSPGRWGFHTPLLCSPYAAAQVAPRALHLPLQGHAAAPTGSKAPGGSGQSGARARRRAGLLPGTRCAGLTQPNGLAGLQVRVAAIKLSIFVKPRRQAERSSPHGTGLYPKFLLLSPLHPPPAGAPGDISRSAARRSTRCLPRSLPGKRVSSVFLRAHFQHLQAWLDPVKLILSHPPDPTMPRFAPEPWYRLLLSFSQEPTPSAFLLQGAQTFAGILRCSCKSEFMEEPNNNN